MPEETKDSESVQANTEAAGESKESESTATTLATGGAEAAAAEKQAAEEKKAEEAKGAETKKAEEDKAVESKKADGKPAPPTEYKLKMPEDSLLDSSAVERTAAEAKKRGLSNDQAQQLLEDQNRAVSDHLEATSVLSEQWLAEAKADPGIVGKDGSGFDESCEHAKRAIDKYATEGFIKVLNETGIGNHKDVIKTFKAIGLTLREDSWIGAPDRGAKKQKSTEEKFYGTEEKKE